MFPVRCYTCNTVLAHLHPTYKTRVKREAVSSKDALAELNVTRMCCKRMFLGYVDLIEDQIEYPNLDVKLDEGGTTLRRRVYHERVVSCD